MGYTKLMSTNNKQHVSISSTNQGGVEMRIYYDLTSHEVDLSYRQAKELRDALSEALTYIEADLASNRDTTCTDITTSNLRSVNSNPDGIDLGAAYRIIIQAYLRTNSLREGQNVQYRANTGPKNRNSKWRDAVIASIGPGDVSDRLIKIVPKEYDATEIDVHCKDIRVAR